MRLDYIQNGDNVELMKNIDNDSIDLTVTSPPYDNLRNYGGVIETWNFDKFKQVADELFRITKPGGVVVWVVNDATINGSETGTSFKQALYFKEIGFNIHDTMIYQKQNYMPLTHNRYEQEFEYMFVFSKGKPNTFNPIKIPCKYAGQSSWGTVTNYNAKGEHVPRGHKQIGEEKQHGNIFSYLTNRTKETSGHPAPFPEQLVLDHINTWSNAGDVVFDPFLGSGTTVKMALVSGRHYIGFELNEDYFKIAQNRIGKENSGNGSLWV